MFYLRLLVSVLVSAIVCTLIPWDDFLESSRWDQLIGRYLFLAGALVMIDRVLNACRWHILIDDRNSDISFTQVLSIYFKSSFLGLIAPSSVGGEFLKGYGLMRSGFHVTTSFSSVLVERLLGLLALVLTCVVGFVVFYERLQVIPVVIIERVFLGLFVIGVCCGIVGYFFFPWFEQLINPESNLALRLKEIRDSLQYYQNIKTRLAIALVLSFLVQIVRICFTWLVGLGVGVSLDLPYYVLFVPVISLVSMIPISIAGLGVQEGAFVYFFSLAEANVVVILVMALLVRVLVVISVLPGAFLYMKEGIGSIPTSNEIKISRKNENDETR